jgi:hypothetical protein
MKKQMYQLFISRWAKYDELEGNRISDYFFSAHVAEYRDVHTGCGWTDQGNVLCFLRMASTPDSRYEEDFAEYKNIDVTDKEEVADNFMNERSQERLKKLWDQSGSYAENFDYRNSQLLEELGE